MKRNKRQKKRQRAEASIGELSAETCRIDALIAGGSIRQALDLAKAVHKQYHNTQSEVALARAYEARVGEMSAAGLVAEAEALLDVAKSKCPSAREQFDAQQPTLAARGGHWGAILGCFLREDAGEEQARVEALIRREMTQLTPLVQSEVLPADHPLRVAAGAVMTAFEAVTSGPVSEDRIALPEVSRRSPLAPWKILIRAIHYYYHNEFDQCRQWLSRLDADAAPAPAGQVLHCLIGDIPIEELDRVSRDLAHSLRMNVQPLRKVLTRLDGLISRDDWEEDDLLSTIKSAISACRQYCPSLLVRLGQHLTLLGWSVGMPASMLRSLLGGSSRKDAYFFRLKAQAEELDGNFGNAALFWEEFQRLAVFEGWFEGKSPESGVIFSHIAKLLNRLNSRELDDLRHQSNEIYNDIVGYHQDSPGTQAAYQALHPRPNKGRSYCLTPLDAYQRACEWDPSAENYRKWLATIPSETASHQKARDQIAEAWHQALPRDPYPLLLLTESAEQRNALMKALKYLEAAEAIDKLNPEVQRLRYRLYVSTAFRHVQQAKTHLVRKDLEPLESHPMASQGLRPAFPALIRWICGGLDGDREAREQARWESEGILGSLLAAEWIIKSLCQAAGLSDWETHKTRKKDKAPNGKELLQALERLVVLEKETGLTLKHTLVGREQKSIQAALVRKDCSLDDRSLRLLAEWANQQDYHELTYAATRAGLQRGTPALRARFLYLRACSLRFSASIREEDCLMAAADLAYRDRDQDLLDQLKQKVDYSPSQEAFDESRVEAVIRRELKERTFPEYSPYDYDVRSYYHHNRFNPLKKLFDHLPPFPPEIADLFDEDEDEDGEEDWDADAPTLLSDDEDIDGDADFDTNDLLEFFSDWLVQQMDANLLEKAEELLIDSGIDSFLEMFIPFVVRTMFLYGSPDKGLPPASTLETICPDRWELLKTLYASPHFDAINETIMRGVKNALTKTIDGSFPKGPTTDGLPDNPIEAWL